MTLNEYEAYVQSKIGTPIECSMLGLAGECGELLDLIKKTKYHGHPPNGEKALKELGDILFYLTDLSNRYFGFTLNQVMLANKEKLDKRYKAGFTKEESVNRVDR